MLVYIHRSLYGSALPVVRETHVIVQLGMRVVFSHITPTICYFRYRMVYINSSTLVINSYYEHCIESFDVTTIEMKTYAGACGTEDSQLTGHRINDVRLSSPTGVVFDGSQMIYCLSSRDNTIIGIDTKSDMVHPVCYTSGVFGRSLAFDHSTQSLFIALRNAIGKVEVSSGVLEVISGSTTSGDSVGDLRTTKYNSIFNLLWVNSSTLMVSDQRNDRLV